MVDLPKWPKHREYSPLEWFPWWLNVVIGTGLLARAATLHDHHHYDNFSTPTRVLVRFGLIFLTFGFLMLFAKLRRRRGE